MKEDLEALAAAKKHAGVLASLRDDISLVVYEVKNSEKYPLRKALAGAAARLEQRLQDELEMTVCDATTSFNNLKSPLILGLQWAEAARTARTTNSFVLLRRARASSAALLTQQKIEFLRGTCADTSPAAAFVLVGEKQMCILQDDFEDEEALDECLFEFARTARSAPTTTHSPRKEPAEEQTEGSEQPPEKATGVPTMTAAMYEARRDTVFALLDELGVDDLGDAAGAR